MALIDDTATRDNVAAGGGDGELRGAEHLVDWVQNLRTAVADAPDDWIDIPDATDPMPSPEWCTPATVRRAGRHRRGE